MPYTIKAGNDIAVVAKSARTPVEAIRMGRAMRAQRLPAVTIDNGGQVWSLEAFEELYEAEARNA